MKELQHAAIKIEVTGVTPEPAVISLSCHLPEGWDRGSFFAQAIVEAVNGISRNLPGEEASSLHDRILRALGPP
jgi:hypothetical protein